MIDGKYYSLFEKEFGLEEVESLCFLVVVGEGVVN